MKCNIPINNKLRKQIDVHAKQRVAEHYEKQGEEITRRIFKLFCVALHNEFGFGLQRLSKLLLAVSKLIEQSRSDEVFWYHTDRELKAIGLDFPNEDYEVMDERKHLLIVYTTKCVGQLIQTTVLYVVIS